jgi:hypothetical protein
LIITKASHGGTGTNPFQIRQPNEKYLAAKREQGKSPQEAILGLAADRGGLAGRWTALGRCHTDALYSGRELACDDPGRG